MASLQKFNGLFSELYDEVAALDRRKTDLGQECITSEAKVKHLKGVITDLESQLMTKQMQSETLIAQTRDDISTLDGLKTAAQKALIQLEEKTALARSDLEAVVHTNDEEITRLTNQLEAKKAELTKVTTTKVATKAEIDAIELVIVTRTTDLEALDQQLADKQFETTKAMQELDLGFEHTQRELDGLKHKVDDKQDEYEELATKVTESEQSLASDRKQHQDFLAYEERAKVALKAREDALLEREKQLEVNIVTSRRRNSVLDNL